MSSSWKAAVDRLPGIFKYFLIIGVIAIISLLFPDQGKFKYQFEKGQTWHYEDLVAPVDYAIKKPQAEIQEEKETLLQDFRPYYQWNTDLADEQMEAFRSEFETQLDQVRTGNQFPDVLQFPDRYFRFGERFLNSLYRQGIISSAPEQSDKDPDYEVNVLRGNLAQRQPAGGFVTIDQAKAILSDTLTKSQLKEPEFLYPVVEDHLKANIVYSDTLTSKFREDLLSTVSSHRGMVQKGELIIPRDGVVNDDAYQKLVSLKEQYELTLSDNQSYWGIFGGYLLLTVLVIGMFSIYLARYAPEVFGSLNNMIFIFSWFVVTSYLVYVVDRTDVISIYLIPFCVVPIVIKTFFNSRIALFTHITVILLASILSAEGYDFTFLQILAGLVVLLSNVDTRDWSQFFYSMLFIFLTYALGYLGLSLIRDGMVANLDWSMYTWLFLSVFLTLLAYPLIPLLERFFGFTSSITLVELSDLNRPLLRELATKAPGTLQHSLQVANLGEAAARAIGANPLLVKVGALYHDVGKTLNPNYFIENQSGKSPHDDISELESAKIIVGHVTEGAKMARKARLPKLLIDFILTHHGTTRVEYFYRNYLKKNPEVEVDEEQFRYPGPRPRSKEEAILMLADSIEAASKSLKNPTERDIDELVDKIIASKIDQDQLMDATITFQELEKSRTIFKKLLKSIYHVRIEYPEEEKGPKKTGTAGDGNETPSSQPTLSPETKE